MYDLVNETFTNVGGFSAAVHIFSFPTRTTRPAHLFKTNVGVVVRNVMVNMITSYTHINGVGLLDDCVRLRDAIWYVRIRLVTAPLTL